MEKNKYNELEVVKIKLVKEPSIYSDMPITTTEDAVNLIGKYLTDSDREVFGVLNLTTAGNPISMNIVSIGTLDAAIVSPREVFKSSILANAAAIIVFHCHPSGNVNPSAEDKEATKMLSEAGSLLDIKVVDHIIFGCGNDKKYSFSEHDMLPL